MIVLFLLLLVLILVLAWLAFRKQESGVVKSDSNDPFYPKAVRLLDALQSGSNEGVEKLLAEIMEQDSEKREIYVIFGNVLREKGFIAEAIKVHKSVLHRPNLPDKFKGWSLACLAEDFRLAGMLDRAIRTYRDAFNLNPEDHGLVKRYAHLCKQVGDFEKLLSLMDVLSTSKLLNEEKYRMEVAFVYNELGERFREEDKHTQAEEHFKKAIKLSSKVFPAYLNLARMALEMNGGVAAAEKYLDQLFAMVPEKAFLGLDLYREISEDSFEETCHSLLNRNTEDWRTRLHFARHLAHMKRDEEAFDQLLEAVQTVPHVLLIHQEIWKFLLKCPDRQKYLLEYARITDQIMVFNAPFMCVECRYKSSEFLWKCPSCFGWNTFVESKI